MKQEEITAHMHLMHYLYAWGRPMPVVGPQAMTIHYSVESVQLGGVNQTKLETIIF